MNRKNSLLIRLLCFCLVVTMIAPCSAYAAAQEETVMPCASYYLDAYNTYVCAMGSGKLEIWFEVMGTGIMDEIGTLSIKLYESTNQTTWTRVKTFSHENYDSMLIEDDFYHSSYVSYQGVAGRYYKAYVCIWSGKNGTGDTRYMWTSVERAT